MEHSELREHSWTCLDILSMRIQVAERSPTDLGKPKLIQGSTMPPEVIWNDGSDWEKNLHWLELQQMISQLRLMIRIGIEDFGYGSSWHEGLESAMLAKGSAEVYAAAAATLNPATPTELKVM